MNIIQKTFSIEDIIENFDLEDIKEILIFYSKFEYSLKVLEKFMKVISVLIDSENFEYALKVLFELTSRNPLTLSYFTTSLLKKILDFLNQNSETQLLCLKILGNFVLNYENSFIKLVPLNIFSIWLPILQKNNSASTKEILWIISNLVSESNTVTELLILSHGFEKIFEMLNHEDLKIQKEVVYILFNACKAASINQSEYFVNSGCLVSISRLFFNFSKEFQYIALKTIQSFLKKFEKIEKEELWEITENIKPFIQADQKVFIFYKFFIFLLEKT